MITLVRDRKTIYYATYEGWEEVQKDGLYSGERRKRYSPVQKLKIPVSGARTAYGFVSNVVQMEMFGLDKPYSKTMWTHDKTLPITEETILWMGMGTLAEYDPASTYEIGEKVIHDGRIYECVSAVEAPTDFQPFAWASVPHNYIVTGVSETPNMVGYAIKEVDFSEDNY